MVGLEMCTVADAPAAMSPKEQLNVFEAIEHVPGPAYAGLIDQLMPVPVGNGSERLAALAVPGPGFVT